MDEYIKNKNIQWYKKTYESLILKGKSRKFLDEGEIYEKHHIVPKCLGGSNDESNIVILTYREHIIAHMLLAKIYHDNYKILYAASMMLSVKVTTLDGKRIKIKNFSNSKEASELKKRAGKLRGNSFITEESKEKWRSSMKKNLSNLSKEERSKKYGKSGKDNKSYGIPRTEEVKRKISEAQKGKPRGPLSKEAIEKMRSKLIGLPKSEEHRKHMSEAKKGRIVTEEEKEKRKNTIKERGISFRKSKDELFKPKRVQGPDGTIYNSAKECADSIGYNYITVIRWLNHNPEKGYKYIDN